MEPVNPRVIRLSGPARLVTALVTAGVALAAVPATAALASSGTAGHPGSHGGPGAPGGRAPGANAGKPGHPDGGEHNPAAQLPGWEALSRLFSPVRCAEHGRPPAWGPALHGDLTLNAQGGPVAVTAQQGVVSAVDATTFTVVSPDLVTITWGLAPSGHVVSPGHADALSALQVGQVVTVVGNATGSLTGTPAATGTSTSTSTDTSTGTSTGSLAGATGSAPSLLALLVVVPPCHHEAPVPTPSTTSPSTSTTPSTSSSS